MWKLIDIFSYWLVSLFDNWTSGLFKRRLERRIIRKANERSITAEQMNSLAELLPDTIKDDGKNSFYFSDCSNLDLLRLLYNMHQH